MMDKKQGVMQGALMVDMKAGLREMQKAVMMERWMVVEMALLEVVKKVTQLVAMMVLRKELGLVDQMES